MPEKLVTLTTFSSPVEAQMAKNLLEAHGIVAYLADEETVGMYWLLGNAIGGVKLQVADSDLERAADTLETRGQRNAPVPEPEETFSEARTCPACRKSFPAECDYCPSCGPPEEFDDSPETAVTTEDVLAREEVAQIAQRTFPKTVIIVLAWIFALFFVLRGILAE